MENNNFEAKDNKNVKGVNPLVVVFLSLLLIIGCGFGGWYLGTQYANNEDKKDSNKVEEIKDKNKTDEGKEESGKPEKNNKYTFKKERHVDANYTNEKSENVYDVIAYYYIDTEEVENYDEKKENYFVVRRDVFVNNKPITETLIVDAVKTEDEANEAITNDDLSSLKSLKDTKNGDAYLVISLINQNSLVYDGKISFMDVENGVTYIVNKSGVVLKELSLYDYVEYVQAIFVNKNEIEDRKSFSPDQIEGFDVSELNVYEGLTTQDVQHAIYANNVKVDVLDNHIYYIDLIDCDTVFEYKIVISNGLLSDEHISSYSGNKVLLAGQC